MKNIIIAMSLCISIFVLYSCEKESNNTDVRLVDMKSAIVLSQLQLRNVKEEYGPFYSGIRPVKNAEGEILGHVNLCFTITGEEGKRWKVRVEFFRSKGNKKKPKVDLWMQDTDGDGKYDEMKVDSEPHDGKFDRKWKDKNNDGEIQQNEVEDIDPPEPVPDMPQ